MDRESVAMVQGYFGALLVVAICSVFLPAEHIPLLLAFSAIAMGCFLIVDDFIKQTRR